MSQTDLQMCSPPLLLHRITNSLLNFMIIYRGNLSILKVFKSYFVLCRHSLARSKEFLLLYHFLLEIMCFKTSGCYSITLKNFRDITLYSESETSKYPFMLLLLFFHNFVLVIGILRFTSFIHVAISAWAAVTVLVMHSEAVEKNEDLQTVRSSRATEASLMVFI